MSIVITIVVRKHNPAPIIDNSSQPASSSAQAQESAQLVVIQDHQEKVYSPVLDRKETKRLTDIHTIAPSIDALLANFTQLELRKLYKEPIYIKLDYPDQKTIQFFTIVGSAGALLNVLKSKEHREIGTLIINDRLQDYHDPNKEYFGGMVSLKKRFDQMGAAPQAGVSLSSVSALCVELAPNVATIIDGITKLFQCVSLKQISSIEVLPKKGKVTWWITNIYRKADGPGPILEKSALKRLFQDGLTPPSLVPNLRRLRLPIWEYKTLMENVPLFSQLEHLIIDNLSLAIGETTHNREKRSLSRQPYFLQKKSVDDEDEVSQAIDGLAQGTFYFSPEEEKEEDILLSFFTAQKENNLRSIELYDWRQDPLPPVFMHKQLALYIQEGLFPKLNAIMMRLPTSYDEYETSPIDPNTASNTSDLLQVVLGSSSSILKLVLCMPEKLDYTPWLEAISLGKFALLEELHYLTPVPYQSEKSEDHFERIRRALEKIKIAIDSGKVPKLKKILIHGHIPKKLETWIQEIENADLIVKNNALSQVPHSEARELDEEDFFIIESNKP